MINIDPNSTQAIYQQVYQQFVKLIIARVLKPKDKLPSVRELAAMIRLNPNTIQKAYKELEANHFIYSVKGVGYFVGSSKIYLQFYKKEVEHKLKENVLALKRMGIDNQTILTLINTILEEGADQNAKSQSPN